MNNGLKYHNNCFRCSLCDQTMTVAKHFTVDSKLFCEKCYNDKKAHKCNGCQKVVGKEPTIMTPDKKVYHKACFKCDKCGNLIESGFTLNKKGLPEHKDCTVPDRGVLVCLVSTYNERVKRKFVNTP